MLDEPVHRHRDAGSHRPERREAHVLEQRLIDGVHRLEEGIPNRVNVSVGEGERVGGHAVVTLVLRQHGAVQVSKSGPLRYIRLHDEVLHGRHGLVEQGLHSRLVTSGRRLHDARLVVVELRDARQDGVAGRLGSECARKLRLPFDGKGTRRQRLHAGPGLQSTDRLLRLHGQRSDQQQRESDERRFAGHVVLQKVYRDVKC